MPLSIRIPYQLVQEGSLAAVAAEALLCASCLRVNDACSFLFASGVSSKVGLPFLFCESVS